MSRDWARSFKQTFDVQLIMIQPVTITLDVIQCDNDSRSQVEKSTKID